MIDNLTLACGALTTGAALVVCIVDILPARKRKPDTDLQQQESAPFLDRLQR